jgi:hypothetical protein
MLLRSYVETQLARKKLMCLLCKHISFDKHSQANQLIPTDFFPVSRHIPLTLEMTTKAVWIRLRLTIKSTLPVPGSTGILPVHAQSPQDESRHGNFLVL